VIVQAAGNLHRLEREKLERSIEKFTCCPVRILVVNPYECRIMVTRGSEHFRLIDPDLPGTPTLPGIVNVSCRKVEFKDGDQVTVFLPQWTDGRTKFVKAEIRKWVGASTEVVFTILPGWKVLPVPGQ
jgi:hypothetical protein